MDQRVLELCYDLSAITGHNPHDPVDPRIARFRDAVMRRIDAVLFEDGLGSGRGADLDDDRLRLRFTVEDFCAAEARVGRVIESSPLAPPVEYLRYWDEEAVI